MPTFVIGYSRFPFIFHKLKLEKEFPGSSGRPRFDPWVGKIPWRRQWHPTPVLLPGESHGQRSLVGYSPWCPKESDTTERLHFHFTLLFSRSFVFDSLQLHGLQQARLSCPSLSPGACSDSCPLSR